MQQQEQGNLLACFFSSPFTVVKNTLAYSVEYKLYCSLGYLLFSWLVVNDVPSQWCKLRIACDRFMVGDFLHTGMRRNNQGRRREARKSDSPVVIASDRDTSRRRKELISWGIHEVRRWPWKGEEKIVRSVTRVRTQLRVKQREKETKKEEETVAVSLKVFSCVCESPLVTRWTVNL